MTFSGEQTSQSHLKQRKMTWNKQTFSMARQEKNVRMKTIFMNRVLEKATQKNGLGFALEEQVRFRCIKRKCIPSMGNAS